MVKHEIDDGKRPGKTLKWSLSKSITGDMVVKAVDPDGYGWEVVCFRPDGTYCRSTIDSAATGLQVDDKDRILLKEE
jgi:hypothetical protein